MKWFGYVGKYARINLSTKSVVVEDLKPEFAKKYIGGAGFGARILWDELKGGEDPFSPENKLIVSTGPFTGTLIPGSGNIFYQFKSPLTGGWGETRSGGKFGSMLKYAGFDFLIIEGRAEEPVYLLVMDGKIEIKSVRGACNTRSIHCMYWSCRRKTSQICCYNE